MIKILTNPKLSETQYFLCDFASQDEITQFLSSNPLLSASSLDLLPGDKCIIKYDPVLSYYEKLSPWYFKNKCREVSQTAVDYLAAVQRYL